MLFTDSVLSSQASTLNKKGNEAVICFWLFYISDVNIICFIIFFLEYITDNRFYSKHTLVYICFTM